MASEKWSKVSHEPLEAKHLGLVVQELMDVKHKWKVIGAFLGLAKADLECIEHERHNCLSECLLDMVDMWLKERYDTVLYGKPSWLTLVTRLDKALDNNIYLKKIQEKYSIQEPTVSNGEALKNDCESLTSSNSEGSCTSTPCWPFHCGCGQCTEDSMQQCPQPTNSDEVQLLAATTNCTLATTEANDSISTEVRQIEKEFRLLCWKTWNHLKRIDLKDITDFLLGHLQDFWELSSEEKRKLLARMEILKSHKELLKFLASYLSWYNYHLFYVLASLFLRTQAPTLLIISWEAYEEKIQELRTKFVQARDVIRFGNEHDDGTTAMLTLKLIHSSFPLQLVCHIQRILGQEFSISPHLFYLVSIDAFKFEVTYKLHQQKLTIQEDLSPEFANVGVSEIKYGNTAPAVQWKLKKSSSAQSLSKLLHFRNVLPSNEIDIDSKSSENNSTALHKACWRGHQNEVKWIATRFDYNKLHCGKNGWTPAHAAVWGGHLSILQYLLVDCSISPTVCDHHHVSLLHVTAYKGHTEIAQYLVNECGLDVDAPDINDVTPLLQAIHGGNIATFEVLMNKASSTSLRQVTKYGATAALLACKSGNVMMLDRVLGIGGRALLGVADNKNRHCLHYAACSNSPNMLQHVQGLLETRPKIPITPPLVVELAKMSAMYHSGEIVSKLKLTLMKADVQELIISLCNGLNLKLTSDEMQCHIVSAHASDANTSPSFTTRSSPVPIKKQLDQAHMIMTLIKEAGLDSTNMKGISHSVCRSGNIQAAKLLSEKLGMNLNGINDAGENTLHQAATSGSTDLLKYVLSTAIQSSINDSSHNGNLPIHKACMSGSCNIVEFLAKLKQSSLHEKNKDGLTPILVACEHGHYNEAVLLVEQYHCKLRESSKHGINCLHYAALSGSKELVMYLIDKGVPIRNVAKNGNNVLHFATASGNLCLIEYLIEVHHWSPMKENVQGRQPIHIASLRGHKHVFEYFRMKHSCDVQAADNDGYTPLHLACLGGHLHLVTYLTEKLGLDIKNVDGKPHSLVHLACESGCLPLVEKLVDKGCNLRHKVWDGSTSLHRACLSNSVALVKWLITKHKCDPNAKNRGNLRPLYWACAKGHMEVVKYLIEDCQCNARFRTSKGHTCLDVASRYGNINVVKYLQERSKCSIKYSGQTVLHEAAIGGHLTVIDYLILSAKCDPLAKCLSHGRTCLHYAVEYGHLHLVKHLVSQRGVKTDIKDDNGASPLHIAALTNQLEIMEYLVNIGTVQSGLTLIHVIDDRDNTLLHYAASKGCLDIVRYLVEKGLPHNQCNKQGRTPLRDAESNGHMHVADYLKCLTHYNSHNN